MTAITQEEKWKQQIDLLNEKQRRYFAAYEVKTLGYGGISKFSEATGISRDTIYQGIHEIESGGKYEGDRIRHPGAGRKKLADQVPGLVDALKKEANPKADKRVILRWATRSAEHISAALKLRGYPTSPSTVQRICKQKGYALRANKKDLSSGADHPDRDAQFQYINEKARLMQDKGVPVLSIDAKKTEKIGNFQMKGSELMPPGENIHVEDHDFGMKDPKKKDRILKAIPYGIFDITRNEGFINVGIDHNTAELAGESLFRWWNQYGKKEYPKAQEILIFCDSGSSNGKSNRLWKAVLQDFANRTGVTLHVCHYPPGTSKWNDIEHELFCYITTNWRATPLTAYDVVLELIRHTTTKKGLRVYAVLDEHDYETGKGKEITDEDIDAFNIIKDDFHSDWNYSIKPQAEMSILN